MEKGGISIFSESSVENYVAYMPEFQIDKVIPCKYGLLVVPYLKGSYASDMEEEKFLYVLTHPIKQVSKVCQRCNSAQGIRIYLESYNIYYGHYESLSNNVLLL